MLDQSFSAHNFDIIYGIESRKGNISLGNMPDEYQKIIEVIKEANAEIAQLKKEKDDESIEKLQQERELLKGLQKGKEEKLYEYLSGIADEVTKQNFKFNLKKVTLKGKEVFKVDTDTPTTFFAIKQLQYNLRKVFKVIQANRHQILSNIKVFLNSKIPVYVIRTDISSFYESIPQEPLMRMVTENSLLSHKSKAFIRGIIKEYENLKDTDLCRKGFGVPRGVGISAYLSELYMRELDRELSSHREVIFYARYVDDIFMILSSLPHGKDLKTYYIDMVALFNKYQLDLKKHEDDKCQLIDMFNRSNSPVTAFEYLGYKLKVKREGHMTSCRFLMKPDKMSRIREKIDNAIKHFNNLSAINVKQACRDLKDSLDYITGNVVLDKTKSGVKAGLYYSNDLLDDLSCLQELTNHLKDKNVTPYYKLSDCQHIKEIVEKKIKEFDFLKRWKEHKFNRFTHERMKEMDNWLCEGLER